jgi:hypothetical protein
MVHSKLSAYLDNVELEEFILKINRECRLHSERLKRGKERKLSHLMNQVRNKAESNSHSPIGDSSVPFHPRIINQSGVQFNEKEEDFLCKGLKYGLRPFNREKALTNVVADLTMKISAGVNPQKKCAEVILNTPIPTLDDSTRYVIKGLKEKIGKEELILTKADKGNAMVIMKESVYDAKVAEVLEKCGAKVNENFDFTGHVKEVRNVINRSEFIVKGPSQKKAILIPNPVPPLLYGLPKVHKEGTPMRPVVSFISSPTYLLAKLLDRWFKSNVQFDSPYSVKNSISLIDKIKDIILPPGFIFCSFDAIGLFPSIPKAVTIQCMGELLVKAEIPHNVIGEFFDLLKICWSPNFCKFRGKFYEFPEEVGIPIGSPLGSIISEIFMFRFERDLFSSGHPLLGHVLYWVRYVDDVLCTWIGPRDRINEFLKYLNTLYPSVQFTSEVGGPNINFLDLSISARDGQRHDLVSGLSTSERGAESLELDLELNISARGGQLHAFGIYRKDTSTDITIHGSSFCPMTHKLAAFNSLVHRLTNIPLSRNAFQKELSIIKHLALVNEVNIDVGRMVSRKLIKKCLDSTTSLPREVKQKSRERWIRLPFLGNFSFKLGNVLRSYGFRPAYYNPVTIRSLFVRLKDRVPSNERSGVYSLQCGDCRGVYIGETGRQLKIRVGEHIKFWKSRSLGASAFADHLINSGHSFVEGSESLLHLENSFFKRLALEEIEIARHERMNEVTVLNRIIPEASFITTIYQHVHDETQP